MKTKVAGRGVSDKAQSIMNPYCVFHINMYLHHVWFKNTVTEASHILHLFRNHFPSCASELQIDISVAKRIEMNIWLSPLNMSLAIHHVDILIIPCCLILMVFKSWTIKSSKYLCLFKVGFSKLEKHRLPMNELILKNTTKLKRTKVIWIFFFNLHVSYNVWLWCKCSMKHLLQLVI